jgi:hypothetical protein
MAARPFYTRSPRLAFLRALVEEHAKLDFERTDFAAIFRVVDERCADLFPDEDRGGWFSPMFLGGVGINHTPPHLVHAVYGIYSDLMAGSPEPVAFLAQPLNLFGTTAVQLDPTEDYQVASSTGAAAPLTDFLLRIPAKMPEHWICDIYGIPRLREAVTRVGWNMAAESLTTAICGGYLLLHEGLGQVLDPLAASFTMQEEEAFFAEAVIEDRLARYRERVTELIGNPLVVLERNHACAKRVLEAYLAGPLGTTPPRAGSRPPG